MLSRYGTEQVGVSAEIAIADSAGIPINPAYRERGRPELIKHVMAPISEALSTIPKPIKHVAEGGGPIDFHLEGARTLSVKTNMKTSTKFCPQIIGQPSREKFWEFFSEYVPSGVVIDELSVPELNSMFKLVARANISDLLTAYWANLFDCDFMIIVREVLTKDDELSPLPNVSIYKKSVSPIWDASRITYTKDLANWNESCTVKYDGVSIGEFQVHNNRNCYKFRFIAQGLVAVGLL
jgi:hypothetical protein